MIWVELDQYDEETGTSVRGNLVAVIKQVRYFHRPNYAKGWILSAPLHEWMMERVESYEISWSEIKFGYWHLGFTDQDVAILFKLTWL